MADNFVDQLTLNFLISKQQLQKLNKKTKETTEQKIIEDINEFSDRIQSLFNDLLVFQPPEDLLFDVKVSFDNFIEKSIYYFKAHDKTEHLEKERQDIIKDDIDFDKEEREIERGNYRENCSSDKDDDYEDNDDNEDNEDNDEDNDDYEDKYDKNIARKNQPIQIKKEQPIIVKSKYNKKTTSVGVDNINNLPTDWFQHVKLKQKQRKIIPRNKDVNFSDNND